MQAQMQAIWGDIWKHTVEKRQTNVINVTMLPFGQTNWWHTWKSMFKLIKFIKASHGEAEKPNKCYQCDYASSQAGNLRTHLKTHSGEKTNKCNLCDYASSQAVHLRTHLKTRSGEKPNYVTISGETLCRNNCQSIGMSLIGLARQV